MEIAELKKMRKKSTQNPKNRERKNRKRGNKTTLPDQVSQTQQQEWGYKIISGRDGHLIFRVLETWGLWGGEYGVGHRKSKSRKEIFKQKGHNNVGYQPRKEKDEKGHSKPGGDSGEENA